MFFCQSLSANQDNYYLSLALGGSNHKSVERTDLANNYFYELDEGFLFSLAFGRQIDRSIYEIEFLAVQNDINQITNTNLSSNVSDRFSTQGAFINFYGIQPLAHNLWYPYAAIGFGVAKNSLENTLGKDEDQTFAYQGKIGLMQNLSPNSRWFIGYRYLQTQDSIFQFGNNTIKIKSPQKNIYELGFHFAF